MRCASDIRKFNVACVHLNFLQISDDCGTLGNEKKTFSSFQFGKCTASFPLISFRILFDKMEKWKKFNMVLSFLLCNI